MATLQRSTLLSSRPTKYNSTANGVFLQNRVFAHCSINLFKNSRFQKCETPERFDFVNTRNNLGDSLMHLNAVVTPLQCVCGFCSFAWLWKPEILFAWMIWGSVSLRQSKRMWQSCMTTLMKPYPSNSKTNMLVWVIIFTLSSVVLDKWQTESVKINGWQRLIYISPSIMFSKPEFSDNMSGAVQHKGTRWYYDKSIYDAL